MSSSQTNSAVAMSPWAEEDLFCHDLPSVPQPEIGKILVTGASGYIGGRLVPELLARGYRVRVMVRAISPEYCQRWPKAEIIEADALHMPRLIEGLKGVHTAYYLIHSLHLGPKEFKEADLHAAENFRKAAEMNNVKRLIYLGGLGNIDTRLSDHLRNRIEVADELRQGTIPVTTLRAAVIIGSGSASYEIIHHLVKKVPVIPIPYWAKTKCQPLAIRDVIKYLVGVLEIPETAGKTFDIGGKDILTYESMLKILDEMMGRMLGKNRFFFYCPLSFIGIYSYIISLLTPVPANTTYCLMESLKNAVVCRDNTIEQYLPFVTLSYQEAILRAMSREERDIVYTRWSDAYPPGHEFAIKLHELKAPPPYATSYSLVTHKTASSLFNSICRIGGKRGWLHSNWMWRLRGLFDRLLLGVGSSRGRKSYSSLQTGDVIDFWRVEDIQPNQRLLLRAEMKLPGKAWLEFAIHDHGDSRQLSINAYYDTNRLWGKLYWYIFLPFHWLIFGGLITQIDKRSGK
ncbi:MAG: SDR family oxidoreductase [Planctomycetota bacterium]|jgi:uncharacterized protein YbjT (DUF2867 family)